MYSMRQIMLLIMSLFFLLLSLKQSTFMSQQI